MEFQEKLPSVTETNNYSIQRRMSQTYLITTVKEPSHELCEIRELPRRRRTPETASTWVRSRMLWNNPDFSNERLTQIHIYVQDVNRDLFSTYYFAVIIRCALKQEKVFDGWQPA